MVLKKFKYIFLGSTRYSKNTLEFLIKNGYIPEAVFYIPKKYKIKIEGKYIERTNYNFANLKELANKYNIPAYEVNSIEGKRIKDYEDTIKSLSPDFILALGWYYKIPKSIITLAKYGSWGIHASLLPKYAGGAPLVWALINGEKRAGITLFKMNDEIDAGDIIKQRYFNIKYTDTIKNLYDKVEKYSKEILLDIFNKFPNIRFIPQDKSKIKVYPQRKPENGIIDWNKPSLYIYNFIRAQTLPYPCAYTKLNDRIIKIINAKEVFIDSYGYKPGEIALINNKTLVATKDNFIELGDIYYEGKRIRFEDFARAKKIWGGCSGNKISKRVVCYS
jgi:methionyl-tRNA formyltransferase